MVDKPPIGGKELLPLPVHSLSGFRLNPGPVSVLYSPFFLVKGGSFLLQKQGGMRVLGKMLNYNKGTGENKLKTVEWLL